MTDGRTVLLFPGQGAFDGALLAMARREYPEVEQTFTAIDRVTTEMFGRALLPVLFGPAQVEMKDLLREEPWLSQLAIYGSGVAAYRILRGRGLRPDVLMGHSLGEIAALASANAFSVEDGARVVVHRTAAVAEAGPGGYMAALSTPAVRARRLVELIADPELVVAAENHDEQIVLSGPSGAMDTAYAIAGRLGIGTARINSPFPFHSPALRPAMARFAERIRDLAQSPTEPAVCSPILGRYYEPTDVLADLLADHLVRPVAFAEGLRRVHADGGRVFVEAGALTALSKLAGKVLPADSNTFATFASGRVGGLALPDTLTSLRADGRLPDGAAAEIGALLAPGSDPDAFAVFWAESGSEIMNLVGERFRAFSASASRRTEAPAAPGERVEPPVPAPQPDGPQPPAPAADRETLAAEIRSVYATALEYPEEVFTDEVLLEAELGVDSVKQVELLVRVSNRYGIPSTAEGFRLSDYDTMGKVVDYVQDTLAEQGRLQAVVASR